MKEEESRRAVIERAGLKQTTKPSTTPPKSTRTGQPPNSAADTPKKEGESIDIPDVFEPLRKAVETVRPQNGGWRWLGLAVFALVVLHLFLTLLGIQTSALAKFAGSALLFAISGEMMRAWMGWEGFWGLILFKDRSTLAWIDRQAQRYPLLWNTLADLGLVMGYGLCSYFLMSVAQRKPLRLLMLYGVGLPLLLVFAAFVAPTSLTVLGGLVAHNDIQTSSAYMHQMASGAGIITIDVMGTPMQMSVWGLAADAVLVLGGLAATTLLSLVAYACVLAPPVILKIVGIVVSLVTGRPDPNQYVPPPGASPLLPGINLPLVEGILALAVLLVVHEMSHGLLSRISKIRLDSAGIVFFGLLPFGAFVEPDEKELDAATKWEQNRVLVAGSAANLITAMVAFMVLMVFMTQTTSMRVEGWKVVDGPIPAGTMLYSVNGLPFDGQNLTLKPNTPVVLQTNRGQMTPTTDADGHIGIHVEYVTTLADGFEFQYAPQWEWMGFIANVLGLVFALNVLVGIVNLLPIPLFDGHRLMVNGVGNKRWSDALGWLTAIAFVLNFLPWLFR